MNRRSHVRPRIDARDAELAQSRLRAIVFRPVAPCNNLPAMRLRHDAVERLLAPLVRAVRETHEDLPAADGGRGEDFAAEFVFG